MSAWHSLLGVRASCGQALVGGLRSLSGRGFGHVPRGWDQPSSEGICSRARRGPLTAGCLLWQSGWHFCCSHSTDTRPVWGMEGGSRAEACVGSCPSQRRSSLQAGKPRDRSWLPAASLGGRKTQVTAGVLKHPTLWLGPLFLCQPMTPRPQCSALLSVPSPWSQRGPHSNRPPPFASCVIPDRPPFLSKLSFPRLGSGE